MAFIKVNDYTNDKIEYVRIGRSCSLGIPKSIAKDYGYDDHSRCEFYIDDELFLLGIKFNVKDGIKLYGEKTLNRPIQSVFKKLGLNFPNNITTLKHYQKDGMMAIELKPFAVKNDRKTCG